jgi:hypothetical protein
MMTTLVRLVPTATNNLTGVHCDRVRLVYEASMAVNGAANAYLFTPAP